MNGCYGTDNIIMHEIMFDIALIILQYLQFNRQITIVLTFGKTLLLDIIMSEFFCYFILI